MKIDKFEDEHRYLSNFYHAPFIFEGVRYQNAESAFQAAKITDPTRRNAFSNMSPSEAKSLGRRVGLRSDWELTKEEVMYEVVKSKFSQNRGLLTKLIDTGDVEIEEGNTWGDRIWGTVDGIGENRLGKILMEIRKELANS